MTNITFCNILKTEKSVVREVNLFVVAESVVNRTWRQRAQIKFISLFTSSNIVERPYFSWIRWEKQNLEMTLPSSFGAHFFQKLGQNWRGRTWLWQGKWPVIRNTGIATPKLLDLGSVPESVLICKSKLILIPPDSIAELLWESQGIAGVKCTKVGCKVLYQDEVLLLMVILGIRLPRWC